MKFKESTELNSMESLSRPLCARRPCPLASRAFQAFPKYGGGCPRQAAICRSPRIRRSRNRRIEKRTSPLHAERAAYRDELGQYGLSIWLRPIAPYVAARSIIPQKAGCRRAPRPRVWLMKSCRFRLRRPLGGISTNQRARRCDDSPVVLR